MPALPEMQCHVLTVIAERGRIHAYEIKRILKGVVGHPSVYAALSACQAKGYVTAEWSIPGETGSEGGGPPRKYFELTAAGRKALAETEAEEREQKPAPRRRQATAEARL
jgi:DNA-binding PadR family transcriptional regulator